MNAINVNISGSDQLGRALVSNIVQDGLIKAGFTDTTIVNAVGEPAPMLEPATMMDLVMAANPSLFSTPVTVSDGNSAEQSRSFVIEGSDDEVTLLSSTGRVEVDVAAADDTGIEPDAQAEEDTAAF